LANFFPHLHGRNWALGKNRSAGICFGLEADHAPDVGTLRIGQIPTNHFRHIVGILASDSEAERILEMPTGFCAHTQGEISEGLTHRVQIGSSFNSPNRKSMATGLRHINVHRNLPQASFHHKPF
jgi:hypothetical protein